MARVWQFTTAASRRALRWTRQLVVLLVSVCAAIALGFTLYAVSALPQLQPWHTVPGWITREHVLVLGRNCSTTGFYWRAREWMGTEGASFAWYDQPTLMHEMMEFIADFTIAVSEPILENIAPDYVFINEDMAMKNGPLLIPRTYRQFIFPHMSRLVDFFKIKGVRYVIVDTDGNSDALIPLLMEAGVDGIWPMERAADMDPILLRKIYGKQLRLWGGVDKRELTRDRQAIDDHLRTLAPLIEDGGFIPTVDHLVPPDVPLANSVFFGIAGP